MKVVVTPPAALEPITRPAPLFGAVLRGYRRAVPAGDGPRIDHGHLAPETLAWLDRRLAERLPGERAVVCFHHPPLDVHIGLMDPIRLDNPGDLAGEGGQVAEDAKLADAHHGLGILFAVQDRPADAEASFKAALAINPRFGDAHIALGRVYYAQKKTADAETAYTAGRDAEPQRADGWLALANWATGLPG